MGEREKITKRQGRDTWWEFVVLFSRVFAEEAEGEVFLTLRVPYENKVKTVWHNIEHPALLKNPKVTKITCVHVNDFTCRQMIHEGDDKI